MSTMTRKHGILEQHTDSPVARKPMTNQPRAAAPTRPGEITHECIRARAYQIYQARSANGRAGDATSDWLQAERELNGSAPEPCAAAGIETKAQGPRREAACQR